MSETLQSPESQQYINNILDALKQKETSYHPGFHVYDALSSKNLTALVGPTGAGKSTVADEVVRLDSEIALVRSAVTRPLKSSDPEGFRQISYSQFNDDVINENFVNYSVVGRNAYGSYEDSFPSTYNVGPILPGSVEALQTAGFRRFTVAYFVTRGDIYEHRLRQERAQLPDFKARVYEGIESLEFAQNNKAMNWISFVETSDQPNSATKAARKVIDMARGHTSEIMMTTHADELLEGMVSALHRVVRSSR